MWNSYESDVLLSPLNATNSMFSSSWIDAKNVLCFERCIYEITKNVIASYNVPHTRDTNNLKTDFFQIIWTATSISFFAFTRTARVFSIFHLPSLAASCILISEEGSYVTRIHGNFVINFGSVGLYSDRSFRLQTKLKTNVNWRQVTTVSLVQITAENNCQKLLTS